MSIHLSGRQLDQTRLWELLKSELTYYANEVPNQPIESMYNDDASNDAISRLRWT